MRYMLLCMVAAALVVGTAGCKKKPQQNATEIVLGEYASLTGATAAFGQSCNEGLQLALEQINARGGVLGKPVKVIVQDDRSNAEEAMSAVQRLISRDGVVAVIGEVASKRSLSAGQICQSSRIPMLTPASTNPEVTKIGDQIFRICFTDDYQGEVGGRFAADRGWKKVAILTDIANDYSKGLSKGFKDAYQQHGQIVEDMSFREGDKDFKSQLSKIKAANPDAVYLPAYYTEVGLITAQAKELGLNVPFFGGDGWDSPDTFKAASTQGCFFTNHSWAGDPRPEAQQFVKAYAQKYGREPDAMATLGYDAMLIMADAIQRAGKADPAAIRDALAATKDFPAASGVISIDANRNARKAAVVLEISGGKTQMVKTYPPQ